MRLRAELDEAEDEVLAGEDCDERHDGQQGQDARREPSPLGEYRGVGGGGEMWLHGVGDVVGMWVESDHKYTVMSGGRAAMSGLTVRG